MGRISCIRSSCHMLIKSDFLRFGLQTLVSVTPHNAKTTTWSRRNRHFCTSATTTNLTTTTNLGDLSKDLAKEVVDVEVKYMRGLPQVTVPLPSRNEKCQFTLRPVTHNVGDFLDMLKAEDRGIDRATILNDTGVRIAAGCSIENLMGENFWLLLNDKKYFVVPPKREKFTSEEVSTLGDVRALVSQLYETLHIGEHQIIKERELNAKLETLNQQLGPLEEKKVELDVKATRKTTMLTWFGLGLMSAQFGVLARLTWWEYSWDIMEPVTYFVTYGTAIACYAYFVLTKQEYVLPDVKERQHLLTLHKAAQKVGLNLDEYNQIKRQIAEIEYDLRRLRDPLCMHLPAPPPKTPNYSATEIMRSKKLNADQVQSVLGAVAAGQTDPETKSELLKLGKLIETTTKRLKK